jgi:hypothetical protein
LPLDRSPRTRPRREHSALRSAARRIFLVLIRLRRKE